MLLERRHTQLVRYTVKHLTDVRYENEYRQILASLQVLSLLFYRKRLNNKSK